MNIKNENNNIRRKTINTLRESENYKKFKILLIEKNELMQ